MRFSTVSNDEKLHFGTIICCLGVRYKSYCSNIVRTMFVEPTQVRRSVVVCVSHFSLTPLSFLPFLSHIHSPSPPPHLSLSLFLSFSPCITKCYLKACALMSFVIFASEFLLNHTPPSLPSHRRCRTTTPFSYPSTNRSWAGFELVQGCVTSTLELSASSTPIGQTSRITSPRTLGQHCVHACTCTCTCTCCIVYTLAQPCSFLCVQQTEFNVF